MARQVNDIYLRLISEGFTELEKIRSSFRELGKVTNFTEKDISSLRKEITNLGQEEGRSEQLIRGQIEALKGLQKQASFTGSEYSRLTTNIADLDAELRGSTVTIDSHRTALLNNAKASTANAAALADLIKNLQQLQQQTRAGSTAYAQLNTDIAALRQRLDSATEASRAHYSALNQALAVKPQAVLNQWQAYNKILSDVRSTAEQLAEAQSRLSTLGGAPFVAKAQLINQRAAAVNTPEYQRRFGAQGESMPDVANVTEALNNDLDRLRNTLSATIISSQAYIDILVQISNVQRQVSQSTQGLAEALVRNLRAGTTPTTINTINEALGQLRLEINNVDQSTAQGAAQYSTYRSEIVSLERQLKTLANSYRNVADAAKDTAAAERASAETRRQTNLYFNNAATIASTNAVQNILSTGLTPGVALLPAPGQTSAPGTGAARSGGARAPISSSTYFSFQAPFEPNQVNPLRMRRAEQFFGVKPEAITGLNANLGESARILPDVTTKLIAVSRPLQEIYKDLSRIDRKAGGSIDEIQALTRVFTELRSAVNPLSPVFKAAGERLDELDAKLSRLQAPRKRKGFTGLGAAQTAGAVISGGIFGGPEGLLGGVLGAAGGFAAGGGPAALGGAFAGAAIGAQVGVFRQQISSTTEYAAQIDKLKIALKGIVGDQTAYQQALAASAAITRDLNVPQELAIQSLTKLSAAVIGAGGTVNDSSFAFRALAEAVKATGGNAEQVDGAVLALTQVFSKGKVSAEELNQIAERLPGTFTLFAKAAGKTGPELQKALQDGQVGLNDLSKFLELLSGRYRKSALDISGSSQEAGARLQRTFDNLRKVIGDALQPIGADFQNAFDRFLKDIGPGLVVSVDLIGKGVKKLFDAFSGGINIVKNLSGAIKVLSTVLITLAGAQAGAFAVSGITTFISGIKTVVTFTKQLINLERIALAITTARASLMAIIAGLSTGATKGKVAGAILGGGLAAGAAIFGIPKLIESITSQVSSAIDKATKGLAGPAGTPPSGIESTFAAPSADKANKAREDAAKKALADAQAAADQQQQLDVTLAKNQIELAKTVYEAKKRLQEREYELQLELDNLAAEAYLTKLSGAARTSYELAIEYAQKVDAVNKSIADAAARKAQAEQNLNYSRAMERVSSMAPGVSGPTSRPQPAAGLSAAQLRAYNDPNISANSPYYPIGQMVGGDAPVRQRGQAISQMRQYISTTTDVEQAVIQLTYAYTDLQLVQENATKTLPLLQIIYNDKLTKSYAQQTEALKDATEIDQLRLRLQRAGTDPAVITYNVDLLKIRKQLAGDIAGQKAALDTGKQTQVQYTDNVKNLTQAATDNAKALRDNAEAAYALDNALSRVQDTNASKGFQEGINQYIESIGTLRSNISDLTVNGIKGLEDSIFSLVTTGSVNFREFAANILQETARIIIRQLILRTVLQSIFPTPATQFPDLTSAFKLNAYGNVYAKNGIQPFAMGGIVNKPTLFRYANGGIPGTGLMGEAGPEAIIPLQRGANGKLGVAGGGGTYNVTVNVEAGGTTTQTQGDPGQGAQLGRVIAGAVQAELIKQQRPGGLLAQR